ncbi:UPF0481 protein At3g47200-like [Corylus avellana]|uniref:UPF0481 protein At3g47200-like n=1 Tax=Corylus avellana TaxID=13451 RepID=UPI00286D3FF7|nr:UPF0481 protein At3g47200-like [Corylus avellana]
MENIPCSAQLAAVVIDIPRDRANDIPQDPSDSELAEWCIYKVPKQLRKVNEEANTPKLVSIGPFHHNQVELEDMEKHKQRYFVHFLKRTEKSPNDLLKIIKDDKKKIRHCYSEIFERISSSEEHFLVMILLDAIFIIELFLKTSKKEPDYILSKPWLVNYLLYDLILLENQLPFFVLEKLYMFAFNDSSGCNHRKQGKQIEEHKKDLKKEDAPFVRLSRKYFSHFDKEKESIIGEEVKHLTDLLRYMFCSVPELIQQPRKPMVNIYSATKLDYARLKFEAAHERRLLDITFSGNESKWSILTIPQLVIDDNIEVVFRNLIALEQCHYPSEPYICNYVSLMNYIINTEQDVKLLVEKDVIVNHIGSNAKVATLFSELCIQMLVTASCYASLSVEIDEYCKSFWNRSMASIKGTFFRDFGRSIATVGALLALLGLFSSFLSK